MQQQCVLAGETHHQTVHAQQVRLMLHLSMWQSQRHAAQHKLLIRGCYAPGDACWYMFYVMKKN
jgi:hypothetical protein